MLYFFLAVAALIAGYFVYGKFVDNVFGAEPERATPVTRLEDGVDFVKMSPKQIWLVQLLNIAGLGPIIGPILGALYGPAALLWIVIGCIFAGAVHDYFSGMLSMRNDGASIPDVVGNTMGNFAKQFMNVFSVILLILVGVVFINGPAKLLANKIGFGLDAGTAQTVWLTIIFGYYFIATILPVDKIIGRLYPLFAAVLLIMAGGLITMLMVKGIPFYPEGMSLENLHPGDKPIWPLMFITIACGAISGFHSTQSPLMARCVTNERLGRPIFYGAMIGEGVIALIWCTLGMSFYGSAGGLNEALAAGGWAGVVDNISISLMGPVGGLLAIIGVIILPISSGDTAFRSTRLIIADYLKMNQKAAPRRLIIAVPLFAIAFVISQVNFGIIWRYFGFSNQALATIVLWASAVYLARKAKLHWICTIPATFMTAVCVSFICNASIGFNLPYQMSIYIGIGAAAIAFVAFMVKAKADDAAVEESA